MAASGHGTPVIRSDLLGVSRLGALGTSEPNSSDRGGLRLRRGADDHASKSTPRRKRSGPEVGLDRALDITLSSMPTSLCGGQPVSRGRPGSFRTPRLAVSGFGPPYPEVITDPMPDKWHYVDQRSARLRDRRSIFGPSTHRPSPSAAVADRAATTSREAHRGPL